MKSLILASLVFICILQSEGCSQVIQNPPGSGQNIDSKIDYNGKSRYVTVSHISRKTDNSLLVLFIEITNSDSNDRTAYYRVKWLDESGLPVWEDETWKPLLLHGDQKQTVKAGAPTSKAADFKIEFSGEDNFRK